MGDFVVRGASVKKKNASDGGGGGSVLIEV
jgi:hypothetical protein